jgi:hypothetical protein
MYNYPTVMRLSLHLKDRQNIYFHGEDKTKETRKKLNKNSTLMAFFL